MSYKPDEIGETANHYHDMSKRNETKYTHAPDLLFRARHAQQDEETLLQATSYSSGGFLLQFVL